MKFIKCAAGAAAGLFLAVGPANAVLIGVSSGSPGSVYSIDATTGAATLITDITPGSVSLTGASFLGGELYVTDNFASSLLAGTVDTNTGAYTGISDQDGSINWHGLASDEDAGLLYSIDINDNNILKSLAPDGTVTSIGTGAGIDGRGMAFDDANDILYATGSGGLYTVDTTTGTSTLIGSMGIGTGRIGLAFDELTGLLYANSSDTQSLYLVSIITGAATLIGANGIGGIDGLAWIESLEVSDVPVPAALPLFLAGMAGLGFAGRRNRKSA